MVKSGKCIATLSAAFAFASVAFAVGADTDVQVMEKSVPSVSRDHRAASATAIRVAATQSQAGESANACAALSPVSCATASNLYDDSDGMAEVRARFGCTR